MKLNLKSWDDEKKPHTTSIKVKVQGAIGYDQIRRNWRFKQDCFDFFGMRRTQRYAMFNDTDINSRLQNSHFLKTRGRPRKLVKETVDRMIEILEIWGLKARAISWSQLADAVEVSTVFWRTIQRAMMKKNYLKCIACTKTYVPETMNGYTKIMGQKKKGNSYTMTGWKVVRFSDEVHFGANLMRFAENPFAHIHSSRLARKERCTEYAFLRRCSTSSSSGWVRGLH